ncbi:MAG: 1,4-dihydroxy-2-naphthoate octaprenyltransferase [Actinomycetota bacterium]
MVEPMKLWIAGARPRTLPAAVVPVVVGLAVAAGGTNVAWWRAAPALIVSLALQVGVNYANDYSDGVRGTDEVRVGPMRLVGSGAVSASRVKLAAFISFGIAALAGVTIAATTSWWLVLVGLAAIAAAWFYTGGANPYGYIGLGEVFVFVFFGVVATVGTTYAVLERLPSLAWLASLPVGCLACSLLVINNLRDIPTDSVVGKKTLAVRLGDSRTRTFYVGLGWVAAIFVVCCAVQRPAAIVGVLGLVALRPAVRTIRSGATGRELIAALGATGQAQMVFGILFALGLLLGS